MTIILLAGAPGRVCREIAALLGEEPWRGEFRLAPVALSSPARHGEKAELSPGRQVELCEAASLTREVAGNAIIVDFSTPSAALENVRVYTELGLPFVMGTTGFDRSAAESMVQASASVAVIAPNMAIPIVVIQAALEDMARRFPGALAGYELAITESHQAAKKDVSGTARALLPHFRALGGESGTPEISPVRDPAAQRSLGVPEEHLGGHGHHWYALRSAAGDVTLELSHRVNGRRVYAEGTLRAARWLAARARGPEQGVVYTMRDVLAAPITEENQS